MKPASIALALLGLACLSQPAEAALFSIADGDYVALRQAARDAAENNEDDTIVLAPGGHYQPAGRLELASVSGGLRIYGRGATIDGGDADPGRLFDIASDGQLVVADLTIRRVGYTVAEPFFSGGVINNRGATRLRNVTITGTAIDGGEDGIFGAVIDNAGSLDLTNVTLSGNEASGSVFGVLINSNGQANLANATLAANTTADGAEGSLSMIDSSGGDSFVLVNSILADNDNDNCNGPFTSRGGNIADDASCGIDEPSDQPDTDPRLGPLADNGGGVLTHAPASNGPAIDAGESGECTPMDARGIPRPESGVQGAGSTCDPGALEVAEAPDGFQPSVTGSWFDPDQNGHGFMLELLPSGEQLLATWFVFDASGGRDWVQAIGTITDGIAKMTALQTSGGAFPPEFQSENVSVKYWGTLTIVMHGCNAGTAAWMPDGIGYTPGGMPLRRITAVAGLPCQ
jgi:hypothetical protein